MKTPLCLHRFANPIASETTHSILNNPFGSKIPAIAMQASEELQYLLKTNVHGWQHQFGADQQSEGKGKMFGVLVVKTQNGDVGYLATFSATVKDNPHHPFYVPSCFDVSTDDYFINKGMHQLSIMGIDINNETDTQQRQKMKAERKQFSHQLQQKLFSHYRFSNEAGEIKNLLDIFDQWNASKPPAGAGECAAPKLLQYAFDHQLTPIAIAEFWWGQNTNHRHHKAYYPSCEEKCRPILNHMLSSTQLSPTSIIEND